MLPFSIAGLTLKPELKINIIQMMGKRRTAVLKLAIILILLMFIIYEDQILEITDGSSLRISRHLDFSEYEGPFETNEEIDVLPKVTTRRPTTRKIDVVRKRLSLAKQARGKSYFVYLQKTRCLQCNCSKCNIHP